MQKQTAHIPAGGTAQKVLCRSRACLASLRAGSRLARTALPHTAHAKKEKYRLRRKVFCRNIPQKNAGYIYK